MRHTNSLFYSVQYSTQCYDTSIHSWPSVSESSASPDVEGRLYCFTDGTVHLTEGTWAFWSFGICGEGRGPETNLPWILRDHCTFTRLKDDGWILSSLLTSALRAQYLSSSHLGSSSTQRNVLHRVGNKLGRYLKISYLAFSLNFSMAGKNSLPFQALVPQLNCSNCWSSSHSWANICLPTSPGFAPWAQEEQILCPTAALLVLETGTGFPVVTHRTRLQRKIKCPQLFGVLPTYGKGGYIPHRFGGCPELQQRLLCKQVLFPGQEPRPELTMKTIINIYFVTDYGLLVNPHNTPGIRQGFWSTNGWDAENDWVLGSQWL